VTDDLLVKGTEDFVARTEDVARAVVEDAAVADINPTTALDAVVVVVDSVAEVLLLVPSNCPETDTDDVESFTDSLLRLSASLFPVDDTDCTGADDDGTVAV